MKKTIFLSKSAVQTKKIAGQTLKTLLARKSDNTAKILALAGELGSGKTTFVQGIAKALRIKGRITSPSFVIMRRWQIANRKWQIVNFYHVDCYRLDRPKELIDLGFKEIIKQPENLVVIEWADKIKKLIPKETAWVKFEWVREKERRITLKP